MREVEKNAKVNMTMLLDPTMYHKIVRVTKMLSKDRPSLGMRLGHSLIAIAQMYMSDTLTLDYGDKDLKKANYQRAKEFKIVMQSSWSVDVAASARKSSHDSKNESHAQPTASDVKKLNDFLKDRISETLEHLQRNTNEADYISLQSPTVLHCPLQSKPHK